ncbi:hypothetical protein UO65_5444 [Actinokineospora spheciospongiae]|uniref:Uncharacterized protein n=1 Tax=Actinokineospora spheciospongiae TaxID=909613 RepID=W7IRG5_9PSEU|nr:hypothetical protein [Actinokineospora spheciospongiae]EWC59287.1 hypothetical protein UO65_5444 [Actinokineospora spheciospongiae]
MLRDGVVEPTELEADPLFGPTSHQCRTQRLNLRPGDCLVQLTHGMVDHDVADLPAVIRNPAGLHSREVVRAMTKAVRHACRR